MTELEDVKAQIADQETALSLLPSDVQKQLRRAAYASEGVVMSILADDDLTALCLTMALSRTLLRVLEVEAE